VFSFATQVLLVVAFLFGHWLFTFEIGVTSAALTDELSLSE
jgi:hypothetical protein